MNWKRNLRFSTDALWRSPLRTALSASAVAIGIAAVAVLLAVGAGAERAFQAALEEMGKNLLSVNAGLTESDALRGSSRFYETLTLDDWRAVTDLASVERAAPVADSELFLRVGDRTVRATVIGTTPEFRDTNHQRLRAGRFIDDDDVAEASRVAVIGAHVVRELFLGEWPLGERLHVDGVPFTVIGILREKGLDSTGADEDSRILIPVVTAQRRLLDVDYLNRISVQAISRLAMVEAQTEIGELLRSRHELTNGDDFMILDQATVLRAQTQADRSFSRLLAGLAALTLGLGGTGLLAVSLLGVRERYGEIGLRLAVGALPSQVLLQFLAEAAMIAVVGAFAGLMAGAGATMIGERLLGWQLALTWKSVVVPILVSLALSVVFGAYPAFRAARLDPIVALRSK